MYNRMHYPWSPYYLCLKSLIKHCRNISQWSTSCTAYWLINWSTNVFWATKNDVWECKCSAQSAICRTCLPSWGFRYVCWDRCHWAWVAIGYEIFLWICESILFHSSSVHSQMFPYNDPVLINASIANISERMDGWMLFNYTSAQFRPFSVLERLEIKPF